MKKKRYIRLVIDVIFIAIFVWFDQFTKDLAVEKLKNQRAFVLIKNVFELNYLENRGAAFGVFQNQKYIFLITGVLMLLIVLYVLIKMPEGKKYYWFEAAMVLMAGGAIGNMIDRIAQNYVVDFFYFVLINFPIFNMADVYVTVSCVILAIMILFVLKDEELSFLSPIKRKEKQDKE